MRGILVALGTVIVLTLVLAGCATKTTVSTTPTTNSVTSTQPSTTTTKPVTSTPAITTTTTPTSTTVTPKFGGTLRIITDRAPTVIGYPPELGIGAANVVGVCMEPLLHGTANGGLQPWLAESYKVASDSLSITFNLRKGVNFQDGTPFNASAAKWNLDNQIQAKKEPYWKSVDIIDDYTIRVNLTEWRNSILSFFADEPDSFMISPTAFQKNGIDWARKNPVGTGPFKLVSFASDTSFKTVRNPDYWGKDSQGRQLPYLDALEFIFVADPNTQLAVMKSGGGDAVSIEAGKRVADMAAIGFKVYAALVGNNLFCRIQPIQILLFTIRKCVKRWNIRLTAKPFVKL